MNTVTIPLLELAWAEAVAVIIIGKAELGLIGMTQQSHKVQER